jgi:hypothetical protein
MRPIHHTRSNEGVSPRRFSPSFSLRSYIGPCLRTMQLAYFLVNIAMSSACSGAFLPNSEGQGPGAGCQSKREEASTQATWQCGSALFSCLFVLEVSFFSHRLLLLMEILKLVFPAHSFRSPKSHVGAAIVCERVSITRSIYTTRNSLLRSQPRLSMENCSTLLESLFFPCSRDLSGEARGCDTAMTPSSAACVIVVVHECHLHQGPCAASFLCAGNHPALS